MGCLVGQISVVSWLICKKSITLPIVLSQAPEDQSIWCLSYEIFTGYRFGRGSLSKQLFWHTSASTAWLRSTYGNIASRCHLSSAASVDPRTLVDCLFHEQRWITATAVFAVQGPWTWNSLPADLQAPDISVETFRHKLKTFLFAVWLSIQLISRIMRFYDT